MAHLILVWKQSNVLYTWLHKTNDTKSSQFQVWGHTNEHTNLNVCWHIDDQTGLQVWSQADEYILKWFWRHTDEDIKFWEWLTLLVPSLFEHWWAQASLILGSQTKHFKKREEIISNEESRGHQGEKKFSYESDNNHFQLGW